MRCVAHSVYCLRHLRELPDSAPSMIEWVTMPRQHDARRDFWLRATDDSPVRGYFEGDDLPDYAQDRYALADLFSSRLRETVDSMKGGSDDTHWAPVVARRMSDGKDFRYWALAFHSMVSYEYRSWLQRLRRDLATCPFVLDSRLVGDRRVFRQMDSRFLYMRHDVAKAIMAGGFTNICFVPVRLKP